MVRMGASSVARAWVFALAAVAIACLKKESTQGSAAGATNARRMKVGLVTDIGGAGDPQVDDCALRGLEPWPAGDKLPGAGCRDRRREAVKPALAPGGS